MSLCMVSIQEQFVIKSKLWCNEGLMVNEIKVWANFHQILAVFEAPCFMQISHVWLKMLPTWTRVGIFRETVLRKSAKTEKCAWTEQVWTDRICAHPQERSMQPNIEEKSGVIQVHTFLHQTHKTYTQSLQKGVQKGEAETGVTLLWAPSTPQFEFSHEANKVSQKWPPATKTYSKSGPNVAEMVPNLSARHLFQESPRARRTARSDYNNNNTNNSHAHTIETDSYQTDVNLYESTQSVCKRDGSIRPLHPANTSI